VVQEVTEFWLDNTRTSSNTKDVIWVKQFDGTRIQLSKQYLEDTQERMYLRFIFDDPVPLIGLRSFEALKPAHVRPFSDADKITCACKYNTVLQFGLEACILGRRAMVLGEKQTEKEGGELPKHWSKFLEVCLCPVPFGERLRDSKCISGVCGTCMAGWKNVFAMFTPQEKDPKSSITFKWPHLELVVVRDNLGNPLLNKNKEIVKRLRLVQKTTRMVEVIQLRQTLILGHEVGSSARCACNVDILVRAKNGSLKWELHATPANPRLRSDTGCYFLGSFPFHVHEQYQQNGGFRDNLDNLPPGHAIIVMDFSENYTTRHDCEVQSQYFSNKGVTVHVCMIYRHATVLDGARRSTPSNPQLVKDVVFTFSDDGKHDAAFAHQGVRTRLMKDYFNKNGVVQFPVSVLHEWTDGCSGQYKCASSFADIADSK
jgi:hypothetical protein